MSSAPTTHPKSPVGGKRLLDHLVGAGEEQGRNRQTERIRGLGVDDQLELGWLLNRQVRRFRPFEYLVQIDHAAPSGIGKIRADIVGNR